MQRLTFLSAVALLLLLSFASTTLAQVEKVEIRVDGLACPFCAYGLEKKLKKVEGVASVKINVDKGIALLESKKAASIDVDEVEPAVADAGFTPREMKATAIGSVGTVNDTLVFKVAGTDVVFLVKQNDAFRDLQKQMASRPARVSGRLEHETPKGHKGHPFTLVIEKFGPAQ